MVIVSLDWFDDWSNDWSRMDVMFSWWFNHPYMVIYPNGSVQIGPIGSFVGGESSNSFSITNRFSQARMEREACEMVFSSVAS